MTDLIGYRVVRAEDVRTMPIGKRVQGVFGDIQIGFEINNRHKICIGPTEIILPEDMYKAHIQTPEMLEKLADYLSIKGIKVRVRGTVVEGDPMDASDEEKDYVDCHNCILAETFEPDGGLRRAIIEAEKYKPPERQLRLL